MDAVESVVALARENEELSETIDEYDAQFESLIGTRVSITVRAKNRVLYKEATVTEYTPGQGWEAQGDHDNSVYEFDFSDFVQGNIWVIPQKK